jgi:hypothetical protein
LNEQSELQEQKSILCKNCTHVITSPALAVQPHEHTFRNPVGYSFHVLCFSDAPGADDAGSPTLAATWFPDYAWSFAVCQQCRQHIGWWWSGRDRFIGLIAQRLIR